MALEDLTPMLMQMLVNATPQSAASQPPPPPEPTGRDPFSQEQALKNGGFAPEDFAAYKDNMAQEGIHFDNDEAAVKQLDMLRTAGAAGGQMQQQLGGVLGQGGGVLSALGGAQGGPYSPSTNLSGGDTSPQSQAIRQALVYKGLIEGQQAMREHRYLTAAMMPILAPRLLGPLMEQQQAQAQQTAQLANALKIAQFRQKMQSQDVEDALRRAQTEQALSVARKNAAAPQNNYTQVKAPNGIYTFDKATGQLVDTVPLPPSGREAQPPPPRVIVDEKTGNKYNLWYNSYTDRQNDPEGIHYASRDLIQIGKKPSVKDEDQLKDDIRKGYSDVLRQYNEIKALGVEPTGRLLGNILEASKTGGYTGQAVGNLALNAYSKPVQQKLIDMQATLNTANAKMTKYYYGVRQGGGGPLSEQSQRLLVLALMTDPGRQFVSQINATLKMVDRGETAASAPKTESQFTGAPTTRETLGNSTSATAASPVDTQQFNEMTNDFIGALKEKQKRKP